MCKLHAIQVRKGSLEDCMLLLELLHCLKLATNDEKTNTFRHPP
jgi:hypothetical protein